MKIRKILIYDNLKANVGVLVAFIFLLTFPTLKPLLKTKKKQKKN
jgi:hypothetical protein